MIDVTILLDRSESMKIIADVVIKGFNDFIGEKKKTLASDSVFSMLQFNGRHEFLYTNKAPEGVPRLCHKTFVPAGNTALVDAVCFAIDAKGRQLAALPPSERPHKVLFAIITDGEDNSSHLFETHHLHEKISHQREKYSWEFLFLAANQDAIKTAASYGIPRDSSFDFESTPDGTQTMYQDLSRQLKSRRPN